MKLTCFHCRNSYGVAAAQLGTRVQCPHCRQNVELPPDDSHRGGEEDDSRGIGAWLRSGAFGFLSCLIHGALLTIFSLIATDSRQDGGIGEEVRIGRLPSEELSENVDDRFDPAEAEPLPEEEQTLEDLFKDVAMDPIGDDAGIEVPLGEIPPSGPAGEGFAIGGVQGGGGSGVASTATFMGRSATGRRFCIIADCSGSMAGAKVEFVKREVIETINGLTDRMRFQVIFFSNGAIPFHRTAWLDPRRDIAAVVRWLASIRGSGSTHPTPAFEVAFGLRPRPDVIFFMTDGVFEPYEVAAISKLNARGEKKTVIHTISFVDRSGRQLLQRIASASGGKYSHVPGF